MPQFGKRTLSLYLRTGCRRQLRHSLYPDNADFRLQRGLQGLPGKGPVRPGTYQTQEAGEIYQARRVRDLEDSFPAGTVRGAPGRRRGHYQRVLLEQLIPGIQPGQFLIEAEYPVPVEFREANGVADIVDYRGDPLIWSRVRPDILQILEPDATRQMLDVTGAVRERPAGDRRRVIRPIDVKLAGEPSAHYFAEVVYYGMTLAAYLEMRGLSDQYVVHPSPAVWPGMHDASNLAREREAARHEGRIPTPAELLEWLERDLEPAVSEVFAPRIRRVLQEEVREVLSEPDWQALPWHVDSRCMGCDYLGYAWPGARNPVEPTHCWPMAEAQDDICRVAYLTRGAANVLRPLVQSATELGQREQQDPVFDEHHGLRSARALVPIRARALGSGITGLVQYSGTPVSMPTTVDLRIYLSVEFDVTTGITLVFGSSGSWADPQRRVGAAQQQPELWRADYNFIDNSTLDDEWRELERVLLRIQDMLDAARRLDPTSSYQVYFWDSLQFEHFTRVIGRHLPLVLNSPRIAQLAWLFPSEEIVPHPNVVGRQGPITIVSEVVRAHLAADLPHRYGLLQTAERFGYGYRPRPISPFYADPLSDLIPSERAYEIWNKRPRWRRSMRGVEAVVGRKLWALRSIVRRLEGDLRGELRRQNAPLVSAPAVPQAEARISADGQLWYTFARLNAALERYEVHRVWGMPPNEREARFQSARLTHRLHGDEEREALDSFGLAPVPGRRVYQMHESSRELKRKVGDFQVALMPRRASGFLDLTLIQALQGSPFAVAPGIAYRRMADATKVSIAGIDRDRGWIVLDHSPWGPMPSLEDLEQHGVWFERTDLGQLRRVPINLERAVMLEPVHADFFTPKLKKTLRAIGNPPAAGREAEVVRALYQMHLRGAHRTAQLPAGEVLWEALRLSEEVVPRDVVAARARLAAIGVELNDSQWRAWSHALSRRLHLIWGPPGTGKSKTLRAVILGAAADAAARGVRMRILVTANTYGAIDNVLDGLPLSLERLALPDLHVVRLRSESTEVRPPEDGVPIHDEVIDNDAPPARARLQRREGITIVTGPPQQVHKLMAAGGQSAAQQLFDLIVLDEASQVDVANATLPIAGLAAQGGVVLAGDHLQMAPIHQAEPPRDLEFLVGSVFEYFRRRFNIRADQLDRNYRSNQEIVEFSQRAGYEDRIEPHSPAIRLNLAEPLPVANAPGDWPEGLIWTPEWAEILDPELPTVAYLYPDGRNGQSNQFESDAVTALLHLLRGRLGGVSGDLAPDGTPKPALGRSYTDEEFWTQGVGVVTPHRAQQGRLVDQLQRTMGTLATRGLIRDAVDTVERFQGQQRDVIIVSFAVGDPDVVSLEENFLFELTRFNVMTSRPRAKLIVLASQELIDHLPSNPRMLEASRLLKVYADSHCARERPIQIGPVRGRLRHP